MLARQSFLIVLLLLTYSCSGGDEGSRPGAGGRGGGNRFAGNRPSADQEIQEISVKACRVEEQPISNYILSNTTLEPIRAVTVVARVNAQLIHLEVEEGDRVRAGQILARLDEREVRNEHDQARIAVDQAEISVRQAKVRADQSRANLERSQTLKTQKLISQQDFDQAELNERTDMLAHEVAQQQLGAAEVRLQAAVLQLEYTEIRAPIDGVITQRSVEIGDRLSLNQSLFEVEDFTPLWARIFIPEKDLSKLRIGQTASVDIEAFSERRFRGRVRMINPRIDSESGTVKVTLEMQDPEGRLRPGMFGLVYIPTETKDDALVIPKKALLRERDEIRVFVIRDNGTAEKRTVRVGIFEENRVEIVSGLQAGEAVVTVGQEGLNDSYPVKVLAWETSTGKETSSPVDRPAPARRVAGTPPQREASARPAGTDASARPEGRRPGGRRGQGRGNRAAMLERMMQNPEFKKAYDAAVKEDPELATDVAKLRIFVREWFTKMRGGGA